MARCATRSLGCLRPRSVRGSRQASVSLRKQSLMMFCAAVACEVVGSKSSLAGLLGVLTEIMGVEDLAHSQSQ